MVFSDNDLTRNELEKVSEIKRKIDECNEYLQYVCTEDNNRLLNVHICSSNSCIRPMPYIQLSKDGIKELVYKRMSELTIQLNDIEGRILGS